MHDTSFWDAKASDYLQALRLAAELGGYGSGRIAEWVNGDATEAETILHNHGEHQAAALVADLRGEASKTIASVRLHMSRVLAQAERDGTTRDATPRDYPDGPAGTRPGAQPASAQFERDAGQPLTAEAVPEAELAARDAGADTAEVIIRTQLEDGVPTGQIEVSAERALAAWFGSGAAAAMAFCRGYAQVAHAYVDAATEFDLDADHEAGLGD